jgi:hypothetical protein
MAIKRSIGLRNAGLNAGYGPAFDGGSCRINVYTGAQPTTAELAATGTLLGTLTPSSDVFAVAANGAAALNAVASVAAAASGTAGWVRVFRTTDSAPTAAAAATDLRMDLLIGTDIAIDNANVVAGGTLALSGWTLSESS